MKTPEEGYALGWADAIYAYESRQRKQMSTNYGGPAYPGTEVNGLNCGATGMSLRDYFAAKAMQALLTKWPPMEVTERERIALVKDLAESAFDVADSMLKAREA